MEKIKTIAEYQQLAKRTCASLENLGTNMVHMSLGVMTEIGEVLDILKKNLAYGKEIDVVNLGEELADIAWYLANRANFKEFELELVEEEDKIKEFRKVFEEDMFIPEVTREDRVLSIMASLLSLETTDREISIEENVMVHPNIKVEVLRVIAHWYDLDFFQLLTNNINKLKVRYPEKFDNDKAINRDLEAERAELEK